MTREHSAELHVHPSTPADAVQGLSATVQLERPGLLVLRYRLEADLSRVRVPASGPGERTDGLWQHTCFEAFVAGAGETAYREFNFSASRDWAAYAFSAYRQDMAPAQMRAAPQIEVRRSEGLLQLDCRVEWPPDTASVALRVGLSAVIESDDGRISYWALRHAPEKPDFHHPDSFALYLTS